MKFVISALIIVLFGLGVQGLNKVCYGRYGCFDDGGPFHGILTQLPASPVGVGTTYRLFTRKTLPLLSEETVDDADTTKLLSSTFDDQLLTKILIHGYLEPKFGVKHWMLRMKDELLAYDNLNVVLVSWTNGNKFPYIQAAANARMVGAMISEFILFLINQTAATCDQVHVIGFSLGSHVAGYAGKRSVKRGCMFGRITGLDPAGPLFDSDSPVVRLHRDDANFVDAIHTDTCVTSLGIVGSLGLARPISDADFYPNGGYHQPGCALSINDFNLIQSIKDLVVCSHNRAVMYYLESINGKCQMRSFPCTSPRLFDNGQCASCQRRECQVMGFHARKPAGKSPVQYYLKTRSESSFCGYHYKITMYTGDTFRGGISSKMYVTLTGEYGVEEDVELEKRDHKRGSSQSFVILTEADLGDLLQIQIWFNNYFAFWDFWYLDRVTVKPSWRQTEYTSCVGSWLTVFYSKQVKLRNGTKTCV